MVIRPLLPPAPLPGTLDAWSAVEAIQKQPLAECWAIAQPDHACLAGDIAAHLLPSLFPGVDADVVKGIAVHDDGWGTFDDSALQGTEAPRSFLAETPPTFVRAWSASIDRGAQGSPIAAMIISRHFCRLVGLRPGMARDTAEDAELLRGFVAAEERRQRELAAACRAYDIDFLTDVLQFCDVLSLYLCSGAAEDVEFPQLFAFGKVRLQRLRTRDAAAICRFRPRILDGTTEIAVSGRRWPRPNESRQFLFVLE